MYNLLLNLTTGDANAVVRRSLGSGWLAWKRLTSTMNPRTLASGIKAISQVLNPPKISQAVKADAVLDEWEDKLTKLSTEYSQALTNKMKVAVMYSMLPKDMQEKVLDTCTVAWDSTNEGDAGLLYQKVKAQVKNVAKARREMMGPKPMEVDRVSGSWADWTVEEWEVEQENGEDHGHGESDMTMVQYIGEKGGGKKGGFQGHCYICGEYGHSQTYCPKGKGKGFGKEGYSKGYGKDGGYKGYAKGFGKDGSYKGYGKGYGKDIWGKGKGDFGKGGVPMQRACFGCGSTEHILKDCPKNPMKVQQVTEQPEEILFIGNVRDEWKQVPMKVVPSKLMQPLPQPKVCRANRFRVLQVDEEDEEVVQVRSVECEPCGAIPKRDDFEDGTRVKGGKAGAFGPVEVYRGKRPGARTSVPLASTHAYTDPQPGTREGTDMNEVRNVMKGEVSFVCAVGNKDELVNLGVGDIVIDSAADESCWPVGQGDAYPTLRSNRVLKLRTANGGEMVHYGQKDVMIKYKGGEAKDPIGMRFQVTDVKKPLLAVRRLVEKGNIVVLSNVEGESYIMNKEAKVRIPVVKKGGSFVVEAQFVKGFGRQA
jgi:hypothetical protein